MNQYGEIQAYAACLQPNGDAGQQKGIQSNTENTKADMNRNLTSGGTVRYRLFFA
jgi:hypothetical protein